MPRINMQSFGMHNVQRAKGRDNDQQPQQPPERPAFAHGDRPSFGQNKDSGQFVTGGVDPKTQFLATQNIQAKAYQGQGSHSGGHCGGHGRPGGGQWGGGHSGSWGSGGSEGGGNAPPQSGGDSNVNNANFSPPVSNNDPSSDPNTVTGPDSTAGLTSGDVSDAELNRIAGGDPAIVEALKFMLKDPEGAKLVKMMQDKHGTVQDDETLSGGAVGMSPVGGGDNPVVRLKKSAIKNVGDRAQFMFHEFLHVSGDPGDANHANGNDGKDSVYNAQKAFCERMGIPFSS